MLHLTGGVAFGVDVRNFLQLQSAFESDGIVNPAAEIEEIRVAEKLSAELFEFRIALENAFDLVRDARQLLHQSFCRGRGELAADLREIERREHQRGELSGESFGGGHPDFRAGVGVDGAIRLAGKHGADHVADGENFRTLLPRLALRRQRVGRLAGLADGDDERILVEDWIAITEFAAVIHLHGNLR